jgi:hypothetical protein
LEDRLTPSFTYYGGPLLPAVQVQGVYLGSDWAAAGTPYPAQVTQFDGYLNYIVKSPFMDMLQDDHYRVGPGTDTPGQVLNTTLSTGTFLQDSSIQSNLQTAINNGTLVEPNGNSGGVLYMVFVEDNIVVSMGGGNSRNTFYAYHSDFAGTDSHGNATNIYYAVIPYQGTNGNAQVPGLTKTQGMMMVGSHELAEACTDPVPGNGWYDSFNGEIGDVVNRQFVKLGKYPVQRISDKNDWAMTPDKATSLYAVTFTLSAGTVTQTTTRGGTITVATGAASITAQSVDNVGQAMVDIIFTDGSAKEYHTNTDPAKLGKFITLATSSVVDAQAISASSFFLLSDGTVKQYINSGWTQFAQTIKITTGVQSIQAGIGPNGVDQVTMTLIAGGTQVYNDSTGLASGTSSVGGGWGASLISPDPSTDGEALSALAARSVLPAPLAGSGEAVPLAEGTLIYVPPPSEPAWTGLAGTVPGASPAPAGYEQVPSEAVPAPLAAGPSDGDLGALLHAQQAPGRDWTALLDTTVGDEWASV